MNIFYFWILLAHGLTLDNLFENTMKLKYFDFLEMNWNQLWGIISGKFIEVFFLPDLYTQVTNPRREKKNSSENITQKEFTEYLRKCVFQVLLSNTRINNGESFEYTKFDSRGSKLARIACVAAQEKEATIKLITTLYSGLKLTELTLSFSPDEKRLNAIINGRKHNIDKAKRILKILLDRSVEKLCLKAIPQFIYSQITDDGLGAKKIKLAAESSIWKGDGKNKQWNCERMAQDEEYSDGVHIIDIAGSKKSVNSMFSYLKKIASKDNRIDGNQFHPSK